MDAREAERRFQEADTLFREGRYQDAQTVLYGLNEAYPNTRHIVWAMARCHQALGQTQSALDACEYLIQRWDYNRAHRMKARLLSAARQETVRPSPGGVGGGLDVAPPPPPAPAEAESNGFDWLQMALVAGGVLVFVALGTGLLFLAGSGGGGGGESAEAGAETVLALSSGVVFVLALLLQFGLAVAVLYSVLMVMGKLLHATFLENLIDVALFALIVSAVGIIPIIGWGIGLVILSNHYDMSCGELILYVILHAAIWFGVVFLVLAVTGFSILGMMGLAM